MTILIHTLMIDLKWEKKIPDHEGIWLRQCAAKSRVDKLIVTRRIYKDGTETLTTAWGWSGEKALIDVNDPKMKHKLEHFYWLGPFPLPPDSNCLIVVKEG